MTKSEAQARGYCKHCAAYGGPNQFRCGVAQDVKDADCLLEAETVIRWKGEFGLEGETQRFTSNKSFGDKDQMKKKRGRKAKRYLK